MWFFGLFFCNQHEVILKIKRMQLFHLVYYIAFHLIKHAYCVKVQLYFHFLFYNLNLRDLAAEFKKYGRIFMDAKIAIIGYGSMGRMIFEKTLAKRKVTT